MLKIINQATRGIKIASSSFNLLWKHKQLLVYLGLPALITIALELFAYNMLVTPEDAMLPVLAEVDELALSIANAPSWIHYSGMLGILLCSFFIIFFFNAGLIHHTMHILQNEPSSIKESLHAVKNKIGILFGWALISTIALLILQKLTGTITAQMPWLLTVSIALISLGLGVAWSLVTLFVLPIITLERKNLSEALVKSVLILRRYFFTTIAGQILIGVIAICIMGPLLLSRMICSYAWQENYYGVIFSSAMLIFFRCVIATINAIFKTRIYDEFTAPERDLTWMNYPPL